MKLRVIRAFTCRLTGRPYNPGGYYETDDAGRIAELQEAGFVERVPPPAFQEPPEAVETAIETAVRKAPEDTKLPKQHRKK